jgi:hypothetical protein
LVVQVARLLEQFVRSQAHFAAIFAAQSLTLQGHLLSIHHDEAMKKPYQIAAILSESAKLIPSNIGSCLADGADEPFSD